MNMNMNLESIKNIIHIDNVLQSFIKFINEKQFHRFCSQCKSSIVIENIEQNIIHCICNKCNKKNTFFKTICHICNKNVITTKIKHNNTCPFHANIKNINIEIIAKFLNILQNNINSEINKIKTFDQKEKEEIKIIDVVHIKKSPIKIIDIININKNKINNVPAIPTITNIPAIPAITAIPNIIAITAIPNITAVPTATSIPNKEQSKEAIPNKEQSKEVITNIPNKDNVKYIKIGNKLIPIITKK